MIPARFIAPLATLAMFAAGTTAHANKLAPVATAALVKADGTPAGVAQIVRQRGKLMLRITASGLPAGTHGAHLHTTGKCEAPAFTTAGGHLNPGGHQHGTENPAGAHLGDLPNLVVAADGTGMLSAPLMGTQADTIAQLFDADGTAIVIHAGPDDYKTDPSGNSGGRIACGVFARP